VYVSVAKMHHDRRIPLPGFKEFGLGRMDSVPTPAMQVALGLKPGVVSSGDSLDATAECLAIMAENGVAVKEMEAGSIAWVAALFGVPMFCVKAITDVVDGGKATAEEFLENLGAAAAALQAMLPRVLSFVAGRAPNDL
jgi:5'-methylthioadenosine nucleosidase